MSEPTKVNVVPLQDITTRKQRVGKLLDTIVKFKASYDPKILENLPELASDEDIENFKVGLLSENTKEKAGGLILTMLIRNLKVAAEDLAAITDKSSSLLTQNRLIEPAKILSKFINYSDRLSKYTGLLASQGESEQGAHEVERVAISVIEPFLRNITNYMDVKEYLYRINIAVDYLKNMEKNITLADTVQAYIRRITVIADNLSIPLEEQIKPEGMANWNKQVDLPVDGNNFLIECMKTKEVSKEDLDNTTIFKQIQSIVKNLYVVADTYKRVLDNINNFKPETPDVDYVEKTGLFILASQMVATLTTLLEGEPNFKDPSIDKVLTTWSTNLVNLYNIDTDFYVIVEKEARYLNSTGSALFIVSSLLDNILGKL